MLNVFVEKSEEKLHVKFSDGRIMPLKKKSLNKAITSGQKDDKTIKQKLNVGEWFLIDRNVIAKNRKKIRRVCNEEGDVGKVYLKRFKESNKIADKNPDQYPRIIKTYIFKHDWVYKTEQQMRDMCRDMGDGMCDEVICDLELQMRICNGEPAQDLFKVDDKLPHVRVIQLRNGGTGYFGGGVADNYKYQPADLYRLDFNCNNIYYLFTPYAFCRELS